VYSKTEQFVPFTKRRHCILMPSVAESMLGAHLYETFLIDQHDKVIDTAIGSPSKVDYHTCCASLFKISFVYPCMPWLWHLHAAIHIFFCHTPAPPILSRLGYITTAHTAAQLQVATSSCIAKQSVWQAAQHAAWPCSAVNLFTSCVFWSLCVAAVLSICSL
jgi:hypothetical protein